MAESILLVTLQPNGRTRLVIGSESRDPGNILEIWIPACAGMTIFPAILVYFTSLPLHSAEQLLLLEITVILTPREVGKTWDFRSPTRGSDIFQVRFNSYFTQFAWDWWMAKSIRPSLP